MWRFSFGMDPSGVPRGRRRVRRGSCCGRPSSRFGTRPPFPSTLAAVVAQLVFRFAPCALAMHAHAVRPSSSAVADGVDAATWASSVERTQAPGRTAHTSGRTIATSVLHKLDIGNEATHLVDPSIPSVTKPIASYPPNAAARRGSGAFDRCVISEEHSYRPCRCMLGQECLTPTAHEQARVMAEANPKCDS